MSMKAATEAALRVAESFTILGAIVDTAFQGNTNPRNMTSATMHFNANAVTASKVVSGKSTKKKSTKGTAPKPGRS